MRHLRSFTVLLILLLVIPLHAFAGTVESGGGGFGGGGGAGDASLAEQQAQTGLLTTIDADTGTISTNSSTLAGAVKAEDAAHTTGDTGVMSLCVRTDTAAARATTDGDYIPCTTDVDGRIHTTNPAISGTKMRAMLVDSSGNEVVMPTAGLTHYDAADASTNSTNVLNAAGTVYHYSLSNTTTTVYYLRMYNSASAPTCSSATGFVESIPIPPASAAGQVGGRERIMNIGQAFTTGISYCITASSGSTANDAAAAGVFVTILYKAN